MDRTRGCIVYGSVRSSYLRMLDPVQNHTLRLCLGAYRTSPLSRLCILANEPPRQKHSIQYCLKLSTSSHNPAYNSVFNCKVKRSFELKPNQVPPLGIRRQPELQAVGFKKKDVLHCSVPSKPPCVEVIPKPRNFFFAVLRKRQKTYYKTKFAFVLPIHNYNVYS